MRIVRPAKATRQQRRSKSQRINASKRQAAKARQPPSSPQQTSGGGPIPPEGPPGPPTTEGEPEPYRRVANTEQAERFARETLGIEHVRIADAPRAIRQRQAFIQILNQVLEPLYQLRRAGRLMPPGLLVDPDLFEDNPTESQALFEPAGERGPEIRVNPEADLWSDEYAQRQAEWRRFSTADQRGTAYHEYLHFRVYDRNPLIYLALHQGELFLGEVRALGERVSEYATQDALEFASEVYAALKTGHGGYDPEVMALYNQVLRFAGLTEDEL